MADALNFRGSSVQELTDSFHQSIDNYLAVCAKIGKEPDKEFKGSFNVRLPAEMHRQAALAAAREHISLNQFVQKALAGALRAVPTV